MRPELTPDQQRKRDDIVRLGTDLDRNGELAAEIEKHREEVINRSPAEVLGFYLFAVDNRGGKFTEKKGDFGTWQAHRGYWPIGKPYYGGKGKKQRFQEEVRKERVRMAANVLALEALLDAGERNEVLAAEQAVDRLTPPEARRFLDMYRAKLDRRSKP